MTVLVLNASYEPLARLAPLKRALRLVLDGKADVVAADGEAVIRSGRATIPKPVVIKLRKFVKVPWRFRKSVTNTFLFARDRYTCQYCGKHDSDLSDRDALTRDHIQPQSRGGLNTWTNCVTACTTCNTRKADRTPEEAGMRLRSVPTEPHLVYLKWKVRRLTPAQRHYIAQFYGEDWVKGLEEIEGRASA